MLYKSNHVWRYVGLMLRVGLLVALTNCNSNNNKDSDVTAATDPNVVIWDPLTNGKTIANAMLKGGSFTDDGYKITAEEGYVAYETTITQNIIVEFDAKGYQVNEPAHMETNPPDDVANLLSMHDAPLWTDWRGMNWQTLPYCSFRMRKKLALYDPPQIGINGMQIKGGCRASGFEIGSYWHWNARDDGEWTDNWGSGNAVSWDASKTYHWKVSVVGNRTEIYRDGVLLGWGNGFLPQNRYAVYIGGADWNYEGVFSPANVTYSNVKISRVPESQ
jgi:hypothetical protein